MKTTTKPLLLIFAALVFPFLLSAQEMIRQETIARKLLNHLVNKEVDEMMEMFSDSFLEQIPREQVEEIATGLESQLGKYSHVSRVIHEPGDEFHTVILVTRFGDMDLGMRISLDKKDKVAGFFITMAPPESYTPPPVYADSNSFTEIPTEVDCGDIQLPAMLTMPSTGDNIPVIVLVHGSGAHDMDESIGPNKIFRDIAWGLATHGIAVLRYEKRNFRHSNTMDIENLTIWNEVGKDAVHAANMAMKLPGIDPEKVYLLGHSLGGMIAPRIARAVPELNGIISLAGSPRKLYEIVPGQIEHLIAIRGDETGAMAKQLEEINKTVESLRQKKNDPDAVYDEELLGMPSSYLADMNHYDIGEIAAGLPQRILILHGGRDYQVTMDDYQEWKDALKDHPKATFILYPEMNHLFFPGEGISKPSEYFEENNVSEKVIGDIVEWLFN